MNNRVCKIIGGPDTICFIIHTKDEDGYWYWEISRSVWEKFCIGKELLQITEEAANEFINSCEYSHEGCSCGSFHSIEEAVEDYLEKEETL